MKSNFGLFQVEPQTCRRSFGVKLGGQNLKTRFSPLHERYSKAVDTWALFDSSHRPFLKMRMISIQKDSVCAVLT